MRIYANYYTIIFLENIKKNKPIGRVNMPLEIIRNDIIHMKVDAITDLENRLREKIRTEILKTLASLEDLITKQD